MLHEYGGLIRLGLSRGGMAFFLMIELIAPYRPATVSKAGRWLNNIGLALFKTLILRIVFAGAVIRTADHVTRHQTGLLNLLDPPLVIKALITLLFMDFMLYVWHLLNHEMPLLWRFHRVHHSDLNMDVSTAVRFHVGEPAVSSAIKISLVFFLGADLLGVIVFESALLLCAQFHHSSLRTSPVFERYWWALFVPPSMHRIHHSVKIKERDSNYGTVFSFWDRLFGTMVRRVDQAGIIIGVGGHFDPRRLGFFRLQAMPFTRPVR